MKNPTGLPGASVPACNFREHKFIQSLHWDLRITDVRSENCQKRKTLSINALFYRFFISHLCYLEVTTLVWFTSAFMAHFQHTAALPCFRHCRA